MISSIVSFCFVMHYFVSILVLRKRKLVALLLLCIVTINVIWLYLTVPLVGLQCVIVVFPAHTHLILCLLWNLTVTTPSYPFTIVLYGKTAVKCVKA